MQTKKCCKQYQRSVCFDSILFYTLFYQLNMKMRSNIYNKNVLNPKGTLIGNWQEEYSLREFTGEGRQYVILEPQPNLTSLRREAKHLLIPRDYAMTHIREYTASRKSLSTYRTIESTALASTKPTYYRLRGSRPHLKRTRLFKMSKKNSKKKRNSTQMKKTKDTLTPPTKASSWKKIKSQLKLATPQVPRS